MTRNRLPDRLIRFRLFAVHQSDYGAAVAAEGAVPSHRAVENLLVIETPIYSLHTQIGRTFRCAESSLA